MSREITNEAPQPGVVPVVGIVGGHGGIGSLFARVLGEADAAVLVSDRGTTLTNTDLAARCDLTLVVVPLRATPAVLAEVAPHVRPDAGLGSLGSLMEPALPAMYGCAGDTFLLHPLFGPGRRGLGGATFALASLRGARWQRWLRELLERQGARVVGTTAAEHDQAMAGAQALLHGVYAALAPEIMATLPGDDPLAWATPTLRLQLALMARILSQDPALYGDLLALNRHTPLVIDRLMTRLAALRAAALDNPDAVAALFATAHGALGSLGLRLATEGDEALGEAATPRAPATPSVGTRGEQTMVSPEKAMSQAPREGADASQADVSLQGQPQDDAADAHTPSTPGRTIHDLGWTREQAEHMRTRLASFAEDWDSPEMDVYDTL